MKETFSFLLLLVFLSAANAQTFTHRSPKELKQNIGEFVTESSEVLPERGYQLQTFKTTDGGMATLLKFDDKGQMQVTQWPSLKVIVYPNPAANEISVSITGAAGPEGDIEVSDVTGRLVYKQQISGASKVKIKYPTDQLHTPSG